MSSTKRPDSELSAGLKHFLVQ